MDFGVPSTVPPHVVNPPQVPPRWWDTRFEPPTFRPVAGLSLPCGCHVRAPDYEAILCTAHLAELNHPAGVL